MDFFLRIEFFTIGDILEYIWNYSGILEKDNTSAGLEFVSANKSSCWPDRKAEDLSPLSLCITTAVFKISGKKKKGWKKSIQVEFEDTVHHIWDF